MMNFGERIAKLAERRLRLLARHRERYLTAWIAATGLHPTECVLVERTSADGLTVTISVEPRIGAGREG
jgi:hypothetical protein